jgi:predicted lipoprotein with Yx(FWY)xxD motif
MRKTVVAAVVSVFLSLSVTVSVAQMPTAVKIADTTKGKVLVNTDGMTLYTFDRDDNSGTSNCNGKCAVNWPPLAAAADGIKAGDWSVVVRNDGSKQWAYKGKPLYTWMDDKRPGDTDGDGRNNVWHVAVP